MKYVPPTLFSSSRTCHAHAQRFHCSSPTPQRLKLKLLHTRCAHQADKAFDCIIRDSSHNTRVPRSQHTMPADRPSLTCRARLCAATLYVGRWMQTTQPSSCTSAKIPARRIVEIVIIYARMGHSATARQSWQTCHHQHLRVGQQCRTVRRRQQARLQLP